MNRNLYWDDDVEAAPQGCVRFADSDVEVVAYRYNETDLGWQ